MADTPIRILMILGTRPEVIKLAPLAAVLREDPRFSLTVCSTGQHRELLDQAMRLMDLRCDVDLSLMSQDQTLSALAAKALTGLDQQLDRTSPVWVIVQGDTTTALAGAWAAYHRKVKVAHVEAGLRTRDKHQPFPEEINRRVIDVIADLCLAPTPLARQNLLREGVDPAIIEVTGNTGIDALRQTAQRTFPHVEDFLKRLDLGDGPVVLVTAHRRENLGEPMRRIFQALATLARHRPDVRLVVPMHPNPRVRADDDAIRGVANILVIEPVDYAVMVHLLKRSRLVLTDSGGLQEEAPSLGKPVLVLRDVSERPEGVEAGAAVLVGTDPQRIVATANRLLDDHAAYQGMARATDLYGDGRASERIAAALWRHSNAHVRSCES